MKGERKGTDTDAVEVNVGDWPEGIEQISRGKVMGKWGLPLLDGYLCVPRVLRQHAAEPP